MVGYYGNYGRKTSVPYTQVHAQDEGLQLTPGTAAAAAGVMGGIALIAILPIAIISYLIGKKYGLGAGVGAFFGIPIATSLVGRAIKG